MFDKLARFLSDLNTRGGCQGVGQDNARLLLKFLDDNGLQIVHKPDGDSDGK